MVTSMSDEIRIGPLAIRFLLESEVSEGSVASSSSTFPPGPKLSVARRWLGWP